MKSENANNTNVTVNHKNIPKGWKKVKLEEVVDLLKILWKVGDMVGELTSNIKKY